MPPALPPPSTKKGRNQQGAINSLLERFPGYRQYMPIIRQAAARWGMDPVLLLATLAWENPGADARNRNSAGARGLAQIKDTKVGRFNQQQYATFIAQFAPDGRITDARAFSPVFAINYMGWRMTGAIRKYGSLNKAWALGYYGGPFPGSARGKGPAAYVPGWYWGISKTPASPQDVAGKGQERKQAGQQLGAQNPWLQGQAFLDMWHTRLDPIYEAYTGKMATAAEAKRVIKAGWSDYHLQTVLAGQKSFIGSPIWRTQAPGYTGVYQQIYGDRKPDPRLIRYAIIHNLGSDGFSAYLRQGKGYVQSEEFTQHVAQMQTVYQQIFGKPDAQGDYVIKQATIHGWNAEQFAKFLRSQPEYQHSTEFQDNAAKLASVFGGMPTLTRAEALGPPPPAWTQGADTRIEQPGGGQGQGGGGTGGGGAGGSQPPKRKAKQTKRPLPRQLARP